MHKSELDGIEGFQDIEPGRNLVVTPNYTLNAQTVVFVGYSENRFGAQDFDLTQSDRTYFVKLSYAWVV